MKELEQVVLIYIKCQSLLHSIDELSEKPIFKQWLKRQTNRYIKDLERFIRDLEPALSSEEGDMFVELVNELDKFDEQILKNIKVDATNIEQISYICTGRSHIIDRRLLLTLISNP